MILPIDVLNRIRDDLIAANIDVSEKDVNELTRTVIWTLALHYLCDLTDICGAFALFYTSFSSDIMQRLGRVAQGILLYFILVMLVSTFESNDKEYWKRYEKIIETFIKERLE